MEEIRWVGYGGEFKKPITHLLGIGGKHIHYLIVAAKVLNPGTTPCIFWMLQEIEQLLLESVGKGNVVGIHAGDVEPVAGFKALIQSKLVPPIPLPGQ
jgi:hypothetical protein